MSIFARLKHIFMGLITKYQSLLSETLDNSPFKNHSPKELYEPCNYILGIGGKRLRPVLALLGSYIFDGNEKDVLKPSLAIEYFHNFTLMHDDIMDEAPLRRGHQTVHLKYDTNTAILSGDALLIQSYRMFEDLEAETFKTVTQLFSKTAAEICEGQQLDMNFEKQTEVKYDEYIEMITLKTSVLVAAALKMGALIAGANEKDADLLYEYGKNLGIAYQLKDDYLDVFGEKDFGKIHAGDIIENKKTILYIKALEFAKGEDLKELNFWYGMRTENIDKVYAVENIFKKLEIDKKVMELIEEFTQIAMENLNQIDVSAEKKSILKDFAISLINRQI